MYTFVFQQNILQAEDHCESVGAATSSITFICLTKSSGLLFANIYFVAIWICLLNIVWAIASLDIDKSAELISKHLS